MFLPIGAGAGSGAGAIGAGAGAGAGATAVGASSGVGIGAAARLLQRGSPGDQSGGSDLLKSLISSTAQANQNAFRTDNGFYGHMKIKGMKLDKSGYSKISGRKSGKGKWDKL